MLPLPETFFRRLMGVSFVPLGQFRAQVLCAGTIITFAQVRSPALRIAALEALKVMSGASVTCAHSESGLCGQ
jgi:hypothetical protein